MAQEMYKHDAMLHLVWTVAQSGEAWESYSGEKITKGENSYLNEIRQFEGIAIDWDDFNAKRQHLGYKEVIIDEACKAIRGCGKEWKIKCLGYMQLMAWIERETVAYANEHYWFHRMGDEEWELVLRAQRELRLTDEQRDLSYINLPTPTALLPSATDEGIWTPMEAILHLVWIVARASKGRVTREGNSYIRSIIRCEGIIVAPNTFEWRRKNLGYDDEKVFEEACHALHNYTDRVACRTWKIRCLGYMYNMARRAQEDELKNNISDKEWDLIIRAQREFDLTDVDINSTCEGLPSK